MLISWIAISSSSGDSQSYDLGNWPDPERVAAMTSPIDNPHTDTEGLEEETRILNRPDKTWVKLGGGLFRAPEGPEG